MFTDKYTLNLEDYLYTSSLIEKMEGGGKICDISVPVHFRKCICSTNVVEVIYSIHFPRTINQSVDMYDMLLGEGEVELDNKGK